MRTLDRRHLTVGTMLAEGGEGRVHEVVGRPDVLYKAYRRPVPLDAVAPLLAWRQSAQRRDPALARRVTASTAWPLEAVTDPAHPELVTGLLIPRAPERFSVRHRDGVGHLATLSYLTANPRQRRAAYGLNLPPAAAAERVALVYALARLLEAFAAGDELVLAHGDLSTKNVLWSLQRGPEVYVIDCDSSRLFDVGGSPVDRTRRAQVATPNWEDPAAATGADPGPLSDRYSLALIFLRVVGAAHYPIQARQKRGEVLSIDVEIPPGGRRGLRIGRHAQVWDLCARGLGVRHPGDRPAPGVWVPALEQALGELGAGDLVEAVRAAQGPGRPATARYEAGLTEAPVAERDVIVRPVRAEVRADHWVPARAAPGAGSPGTAAARPGTGAAPGRVSFVATRPAAPVVPPVVAPSPPLSEQVKKAARVAWRWWLLTHRRAGRAMRSRGRRLQGVRRAVFCVITDFALACVGLFLVAMIVSPFLGI